MDINEKRSQEEASGVSEKGKKEKKTAMPMAKIDEEATTPADDEKQHENVVDEQEASSVNVAPVADEQEPSCFDRLKRRALTVVVTTCPVCGVQYPKTVKHCDKCDADVQTEYISRFTNRRMAKMWIMFLVGLLLGLLPWLVFFVVRENSDYFTMHHKSNRSHTGDSSCLIYRMGPWGAWEETKKGALKADGSCPTRNRFERVRRRKIDAESENDDCPPSEEYQGDRQRCQLTKGCPNTGKRDKWHYSEGTDNSPGCYLIAAVSSSAMHASQSCGDKKLPSSWGYSETPKLASVTNVHELNTLVDLVLSHVSSDNQKERRVWLGLTLEGLADGRWETGEPLGFLPPWIPSRPFEQRGEVWNCMMLTVPVDKRQIGATMKETVQLSPCLVSKNMSAYGVCKVLAKPVVGSTADVDYTPPVRREQSTTLKPTTATTVRPTTTPITTSTTTTSTAKPTTTPTTASTTRTTTTPTTRPTTTPTTPSTTRATTTPATRPPTTPIATTATTTESTPSTKTTSTSTTTTTTKMPATTTTKGPTTTKKNAKGGGNVMTGLNMLKNSTNTTPTTTITTT